MPMNLAEAEAQLKLIENESETRASHLLFKSQRYWWYGFAAGTVGFSLMASTVYPFWWMTTKIHRVARLRNPIRVKNFHYWTIWANALGITTIVFAASPIGFRSSCHRMSAQASMYDNLLWNSKVLLSEIRRGTFDDASAFGQDASTEMEPQRSDGHRAIKHRLLKKQVLTGKAKDAVRTEEERLAADRTDWFERHLLKKEDDAPLQEPPVDASPGDAEVPAAESPPTPEEETDVVGILVSELQQRRERLAQFY